MTDLDDTRLAGAFEDAMRGEFSALLTARARMGGPSSTSGALWRTAMDGACWLAGIDGWPEPTGLPEPAGVGGLAPDVATRLTHACRQLPLVALVRGDPHQLVRAAELVGRLAQRSGDDGTQAGAELAQKWVQVMAGDASQRARLPEIERRAARMQQAPLVIEAAALYALSLASAGEIDDALEQARRASRMARTEAMPQPEYLANVVLARVRRLSGRPFLATRILSALQQYASGAWQAWIAWELAMAAGSGEGPDTESSARPSPRQPPVQALRALLSAASSGDEEVYRRACRWLQSRLQHWPLFATDLERARAALGDTDARPPDDLLAWCRGASTELPYGLRGIGGDDLREGCQPVASVLASPTSPARRLLTVGAALMDGVARLPHTPRQYGRTDALLATLALAGPKGMTPQLLFRGVWRFKYSHSVHQDVLNTAIHRARERLGAYGELLRGDGKLILHPRVQVLIPDPRCAARRDEQLLRHLASHGCASARDAARALGVPLRSAQASLKQLVADGACQRVRQGRQVSYQVEDTTYRPPTWHGQAGTGR